MMKHKTIPIFVPHMGCPNDCSFCNQRKITGHSETVTPQKADEIINDSLKTVPKGANVEIGFFGGSFTGIEKELQLQLLSVAYGYVKEGSVTSVRLSTRPDYIDAETVSMLKAYGVTTVELGAQSMDDGVLAANHRGHTSQDTVRASELIISGGLKLGLQMMTGFLEDTVKKSRETAKQIIDLTPSCVRIYPTLVLKGTYLAKLYEAGKYVPQSLEEAVVLCAGLKQMFDQNNIAVIRMGLMSSDNIRPENDVVAGPYHPAFGELVQSELNFCRLKEAVHQDCLIAVNPRSLSAFVGNNKANIKKMKQLGYTIKFVQDETVLPQEFKLVTGKAAEHAS